MGKRERNVSRRKFMGVAAGAVAAFAGLSSCRRSAVEAFLQKRLREMTDEEKQQAVSRLQAEAASKHGREVRISTEAARPGVLFAGGLDLSRCIGCRRCEYACVKENNQSRDPQIHWIKVLSMPREAGIDVLEARTDYDPPLVPEEESTYFPISCQQCRSPQCTTVCPVKATWIEDDGIVVVDYNWCIGCRYCMAACPYHARHFNWRDPSIPASEINPETHYLGNRPRFRGVVEKCTFCVQRVRRGRYPACVEICPTGARKFGDLNDPRSEIRYVIEHKRVFVFKEELRTHPKFFYFY